MQSPPPPPPPPQSSHSMNHPSGIENGGHNPGQPQSTTILFCFNTINNVTQLCLGGTIVSALIISNISNWSDSLAQHIILCTVGYFILMTQAILSFSPVGWANSLKYENRKIIHFTMQLIGSILAITGSAIRMADINFNLDSGHAICGFIAMVLTVVSLIGGIVKIIFPQQTNTKMMKILHSCAGSVTISFAFIALIIAFHQYYRLVADNGNANLAIVLSTFALLGTLLMACIKNANRILGK